MHNIIRQGFLYELLNLQLNFKIIKALFTITYLTSLYT